MRVYFCYSSQKRIIFLRPPRRKTDHVPSDPATKNNITYSGALDEEQITHPTPPSTKKISHALRPPRRKTDYAPSDSSTKNRPLMYPSAPSTKNRSRSLRPPRRKTDHNHILQPPRRRTDHGPCGPFDEKQTKQTTHLPTPSTKNRSRTLLPLRRQIDHISYGPFFATHKEDS